MPWQLTTAVQTGDLDSSNYQQVNIVRISDDPTRNYMLVQLEYGNTVGQNWAVGITPYNLQSSISIIGQDYTDLVNNSMPQAEETVYEAVKRSLYEYLYAHSIIGAGTIV